MEENEEVEVKRMDFGLDGVHIKANLLYLNCDGT